MQNISPLKALSCLKCLFTSPTHSTPEYRVLFKLHSVQFSSVSQLCPTLCNPMNRSTPGLPVHHQLPEFAQTHVYRVSDAIQPSHPLSSPSPPAFFKREKAFSTWTLRHLYTLCLLPPIMASGPITSWQIDEEKVEIVTDFILGASKTTADGDCSHEIKRHLLLERKVMINLDSILKSRDITLPTKVHLVKAVVFPVVMYGCEIWTMKKAERQRIDAFELCCCRRLLRVPWLQDQTSQF